MEQLSKEQTNRFRQNKRLPFDIYLSESLGLFSNKSSKPFDTKKRDEKISLREWISTRFADQLGGTQKTQEFTATSNQEEFVITIGILPPSPEAIQVYANGILLYPTINSNPQNYQFTTVSNTVKTFPRDANDLILVRF